MDNNFSDGDYGASTRLAGGMYHNGVAASDGGSSGRYTTSYSFGTPKRAAENGSAKFYSSGRFVFPQTLIIIHALCRPITQARHIRYAYVLCSLQTLARRRKNNDVGREERDPGRGEGGGIERAPVH